jgi:hypothetical protein
MGYAAAIDFCHRILDTLIESFQASPAALLWGVSPTGRDIYNLTQRSAAASLTLTAIRPSSEE